MVLRLVGYRNGTYGAGGGSDVNEDLEGCVTVADDCDAFAMVVVVN